MAYCSTTISETFFPSFKFTDWNQGLWVRIAIVEVGGAINSVGSHWYLTVYPSRKEEQSTASIIWHSCPWAGSSRKRNSIGYIRWRTFTYRSRLHSKMVLHLCLWVFRTGARAVCGHCLPESFHWRRHTCLVKTGSPHIKGKVRYNWFSF